MARGIADVVEIAVLAAGAHALLRGRRARIGPLLGAGEYVLELDHAGVGEQERRVVMGHKRRAGYDLMAMAAEILQEMRAISLRLAMSGGDLGVRIGPKDIAVREVEGKRLGGQSFGTGAVRAPAARGFSAGSRRIPLFFPARRPPVCARGKAAIHRQGPKPLRCPAVLAIKAAPLVALANVTLARPR